jgi:hypothetical protein
MAVHRRDYPRHYLDSRPRCYGCDDVVEAAHSCMVGKPRSTDELAVR